MILSNNRKKTLITKSKLIVVHPDTKEILVLVKSENGNRKFSFLGGNVKKKESHKEGLLREVFEEGNIQLTKKDVVFLRAKIDLDKKTNTITYYFATDKKVEDYRLNEPHKFEDIIWVNYNEAIASLKKKEAAVLMQVFDINHFVKL